jgi:GNAT superfamily N-acetyltransferase
VSRGELRNGPYLPLPLLCVFDRFEEWERANPGGTAQARTDQVEQLYRLYRLDRYSELLRYYLYWRTYFRHHGPEVHAAFVSLIARLFRSSEVSAVNLEELYDLQATLDEPTSRDAFSAMVFPRAPGSRRLEVREVGAGHDRQVTVNTEITDRRGMRLTVREPLSPAEIGHLYRLVRESNHQAWISEHERHLVLTDTADRVIGGLTYLLQDQDVAYLTAIVVAGPLRGRGIGTALLEDFCARMAALGAHLAKTNFIVRHFFTAGGFRPDARWGGLVRRLHPRGEALSLDDFPF